MLASDFDLLRLRKDIQNQSKVLVFLAKQIASMFVVAA